MKAPTHSKTEVATVSKTARALVPLRHLWRRGWLNGALAVFVILLALAFGWSAWGPKDTNSSAQPSPTATESAVKAFSGEQAHLEAQAVARDYIRAYLERDIRACDQDTSPEACRVVLRAAPVYTVQEVSVVHSAAGEVATVVLQADVAEREEPLFLMVKVAGETIKTVRGLSEDNAKRATLGDEG